MFTNRKTTLRRRALPLALLTILASSGTEAVRAQDSSQAAATATQATQKDNQRDSATLQTVTVTADKREENSRDVPSSISVVSAEKLENEHVSSLVDLAGTLPGVQIASGGTPGTTAIAIRGISSLGGGAMVGTYIDDAPLGSSANFARAGSYLLDLLPYDVERIEVLRGPQGTLYGAGAMGGLVKYVMREPDFSGVYGQVGGGLSTIDGSNGTGWDGRASINLPLSSTVAMNASIGENHAPGYVDNVRTGRDDINSVTQRSAHVGLLWKPNDDFSLKLTGLHQSIDAADSSRTSLDPAAPWRPLYGDLDVSKGLAEPFYKRVNFLSATLNWNLPWATFTSATSYSNTGQHLIEDDSATFGVIYPQFGNYPATGLSGFLLDLNLKKFTQEFRLASQPGGQIEWLVGAFYTHESSTNLQTETAQTDTGAPVVGLDPLFVGSVPTTYKEAAVFGDLTYKFNDRFDITGGLRFARNEQSFLQEITGGGGLLVPLGTTPGGSSENVTTWMFSPRWHLDDDNMLYLRAASGYRPGGPNFALPGVPPMVKSDTLINYEGGWKALLADKRVSVDLDAFNIFWHGMQLSASTPNGGITYLANAGTATSRGVEASLAYKPARDLQLGMNAAYIDSFLTADAPSVQGKDGDRIPNVPRWNVALTADYYFPIGGWNGHLGGSYRWVGAYLSAPTSSRFAYHEGNYGVVDANLDFTHDIWTIRAYARNLTNNLAHTSAFYMQDGLTNAVTALDTIRLQPRTLGVEFDLRF